MWYVLSFENLSKIYRNIYTNHLIKRSLIKNYYFHCDGQNIKTRKNRMWYLYLTKLVDEMKNII